MESRHGALIGSGSQNNVNVKGRVWCEFIHIPVGEGHILLSRVKLVSNHHPGQPNGSSLWHLMSNRHF